MPPHSLQSLRGEIPGLLSPPDGTQAEPDSFRSGRCLIQGGNDMILIMAPLKKDKKGQNGAMFIIMDEEASGAEKILQNALPLLRLFTHFDLSEAILEGKV